MKGRALRVALCLLLVLGIARSGDSAQIKNPVVPDGVLGELRHGTYPSPGIGNLTHAGVDLVAPCDSDIFVFADGNVIDTIDNKDDPNFNSLGFMVLIEHPADLIGKPFYTLYLHMYEPPRVKLRDPVKGGETLIGKVGQTGRAIGCHTHFEIRFFSTRFFSRWENIYGPGDQRESPYFKRQWVDPIAFFERYPKGITLDTPQTAFPGQREAEEHVLVAESEKRREEFASAEEEREIRSVERGFLFFLGTDATTQTKFWNYSRISSAGPCGKEVGPNYQLIGEVPRNVSLADHNIAKRLVVRGASLFVEKCNPRKLEHPTVMLFYERFRLGEEQVAAPVSVPHFEIAWYKNYAFAAQQKRLEEVARKRNQEEFFRKYGIRESVGAPDLFANPFSYQGKVIAVRLQFERMVTANSAIFGGGGDAIFLVSSIPTGTYRSKRDESDVLAVQFIGMTEVKGIPFVESMQIPELRFVGVHLCKNVFCTDLLPPPGTFGEVLERTLGVPKPNF